MMREVATVSGRVGVRRVRTTGPVTDRWRKTKKQRPGRRAVVETGGEFFRGDADRGKGSHGRVHGTAARMRTVPACGRLRETAELGCVH